DAAGAEGVVADLAVADVVVRGQADGGAVRRQSGEQALVAEALEIRGLGQGDGVAEAGAAQADTIHDHAQNSVHKALLRGGGKPKEISGGQEPWQSRLYRRRRGE